MGYIPPYSKFDPRDLWERLHIESEKHKKELAELSRRMSAIERKRGTGCNGFRNEGIDSSRNQNYQ